jgi:hypothetical protein
MNSTLAGTEGIISRILLFAHGGRGLIGSGGCREPVLCAGTVTASHRLS